MENKFIARMRPRLEQLFQDNEMNCGEFEDGDYAEESKRPIWPLFAWILSTAVVTVSISLLFAAEYRSTVQLVGGVVIGAILLVPFAKLSRKSRLGTKGK